MKRVVVTGCGAISACGAAPAEIHAALCAGRGGPAAVELAGLGGPVRLRACALPGCRAEDYLGGRNLRPLDRTAQLLCAATHEALRSASWTPAMREAEAVGLVVGTMFSSVHTVADFDRRALTEGPCYASPMDFANTVLNAPAGQAAIWHGLRGSNATVCAGLASGLEALAYASDVIRSGRAAVVLAAGVEELCFETAHGLDRAGFLCRPGPNGEACPVPFDARRNGFALGEGTAALVLEEEGFAGRRGATILGEIRGHGSAYDALDEQQERAASIAEAMRLALDDAGIGQAAIDCISASANGSVSGDRDEAQAIAQVFGPRTPDLPVTAVKSVTGESLGAAGVLQAVAMLEAIRAGRLGGVHGLEEVERGFPLSRTIRHGRPLRIQSALLNGVGLDGHCCSVIVSAYGSQ